MIDEIRKARATFSLIQAIEHLEMANNKIKEAKDLFFISEIENPEWQKISREELIKYGVKIDTSECRIVSYGENVKIYTFEERNQLNEILKTLREIEIKRI